MMTTLQTRFFSGHKYRLADTVLGKKVAQDVAKGFRSRGDLARVEPYGGSRWSGLYRVWVRDRLASTRKSLGYGR